MIKTAKIYLFYLLLLFPIATPAKQLHVRVQQEMKALIKSFKGDVGLYAFVVGKHPHAIAINGSKRYPMASTYKIPLMLQVYRDIDAGKIALQDKIRVTHKKLVPYGIIPYMSLPKTFTIQDLLLLTISLSDNTATDQLFQKVGIKRIQKTLNRFHLSDIHVNRSVHDLIDDWDNGDQEKFERDTRDTATPRAMAKLIGMIIEHKLASKKACHSMLSLLRRQKLNTRIPMYLPSIVLGHKTGSLGYWRNDVGYMKIKNHYIALAIFTRKNSLQQPSYKSNIIIGKLARKVFDYYSNLYQ